MTRPILLIGDDPSAQSGLARITRDLATLLASMEEFRVAVLGQGGTGSVRFPWTQYHMRAGEMGELSLPDVWQEFSRGEDGIVMPVWDCTRLTWLARPEFCEIEPTREWLLQKRREGRVHLWAYMPFDAVGPGGKFTTIVKETLLGIDRIVVPSPVALQWVVNTIGAEEAGRRGAEWLPHGLNLKTFAPTPIYNDAGDASDVKRIGVVMTNQVRKDWGLAATTCAILAERLKGKVKFWWHCDVRDRHWSIDALISDFALGEYVELSAPPVDDVWMAEQYCRCDLTLMPSPEGFGFPAFESLACGVPCIAGDYAALGSLYRTCELTGWLVAPYGERLEGAHNCVRPVYDARTWADTVIKVLSSLPDREWVSSRVRHLSSLTLGHRWKRWFRDGL